jgi:hypothetical protein
MMLPSQKSVTSYQPAQLIENNLWLFTDSRLDIRLAALLFLAVHPRSLSGAWLIPSGIKVMTFAIINPALIIGAVTEHASLGSVLLFCAIWTAVVYVPVATGWYGAAAVLATYSPCVVWAARSARCWLRCSRCPRWTAARSAV